ncbi:glycerophosphodiester phosphodiesterase [Nocardioides daphniae]|uniref:glycerophosphodiester phosphodiesterase n=1 Tax=Nocardioides daphniae TaxID=402297 RepID=UPI00166EE875|nr:glycerophosphodiester phosphodiesterase family protein [Nocardioides daphniae]
MASLSPASATEAAAPKPLTASVGAAVAGERVTFTAKRPTAKKFRTLKATQQRKATIVLQRRDGATWRAVGRVKLGAKKKVTFASAVPTSAKGSVRYRVRAVLGKKTYEAGALTLKVVTQQLTTRPSSSDADVATTYASTLTPVRAGRKLTVERYVDGTWSTVAETSAKGASAALTVAAARFPAWYRVRAAAHNGIASVATAPVRTTLNRRPVEIAHRAGAALGPEQTLGAMEASLTAGATAMEVDVQLTKDAVPVIVHDQTFARTTNVATVFPGREDDPVGTFTWAEVQQLDAGSWAGPQWAGEGIPSLDELLTALGGRAHLVLEVKFWPFNQGTPEERAALRDVLDAELVAGRLGELAGAGKLTVSSFNHEFLQPFAEAHPDVPVGALTFFPPSATQVAQWATWAEEIHGQFALTTWQDTTAARAAGLTTSVWTLATPDQYRVALASGAEALITDNPGLLASVLEPPAPTS